MSLRVRFVRRFASLRPLATGAQRTISTAVISRSSISAFLFAFPPGSQKRFYSSSSSVPPSKNRSFYAVLTERRAQAIDLNAMNERDFAAKVKDMDDRPWRDYMVAFARPEGWMPTIPRTLYVASVKANLWMKDNVQKATAHDFIDYVLVQKHYLKLGGRGSQLAPDVRQGISDWIRIHLLPTLDRDAFFEVVNCLTTLPPVYQPVIASEAAEKIVQASARHIGQAETSSILMFLRSMTMLQFPLHQYNTNLASVVWEALNEKKPRDSNELCKSLLQIITPMPGSAQGKIGSKMISFPIRPPLDKSAWMENLMTLPFNDERFMIGRPLAMKAIVLSIENHCQYLDLSSKDLLRFLRSARANYVDEPRLVFVSKTNAIPPIGMFGELLSVYPVLEQSKRPLFVAFRKEAANTNSSDHLLDEDFWQRFWRMFAGACRKKPLSEICEILRQMRNSARTDVTYINRQMPVPFPARTHQWIDVCLQRLTKLAHYDDLVRLMVYACPENPPADTLMRLCTAYDALDPRSHSQSGLGRIAAEKMQNLQLLARRPDDSCTPREYYVKSLKTAMSDFANKASNVDLTALYQSIQSLSASRDHLVDVRNFMEAFFRHPEQISRVTRPLQWLKICQQLKIPPSPLWWANWCQSLLLPTGNLSEHFSLSLLTDYTYLELKYPDYRLPPIFFDNLKTTIDSLMHQGKVVDGMHKLSRLRVRDTEIAALTEQRLITLIKKHGQTMDVARIIHFLHDLTSVNIRPLSSWWTELNELSKRECAISSSVVFYLLLSSAIHQEVLFERGSVPPSLIEWALKSLISRGCSFKEIDAQGELRRLHLVFGDRPFISAHSDFLAFLSRTGPRRLRSDTTRKEKIYVKEAAVWCSSVNFDKRECTLYFPFNLPYYHRDGAVDSSALNADFAVSIKLLTTAGYQVRVADRSGKTMYIHSNTVGS